jgi:hypothetical protein
MISARNDRTTGRFSRVRRVTAILLVVLTLTLATAPNAFAKAANRDARGQVSPVTDVLLLRPLGIGATLAGAGLFLLSVPIVAITRPTQIGIPWEWLVMKPVRYTWVDPLGDHAHPVE